MPIKLYYPSGASGGIPCEWIVYMKCGATQRDGFVVVCLSN